MKVDLLSNLSAGPVLFRVEDLQAYPPITAWYAGGSGFYLLGWKWGKSMEKPFKVSGYSRPFGLVVSTVTVGLAVIIASTANWGTLGYAVAGGVGTGISAVLMRPRSLVIDGDRARIVAGLRKHLVAEAPVGEVKLLAMPGKLQCALRGNEAVIDRESVFMMSTPWRRLTAALQTASTT